MNWQETVMGEDEMLTCSLVSKYPLRDIKDVIKETAIHQAEITWEARQPEVDEAEERGVQKVVGWIYKNGFELAGDLAVDFIKWQAFLKEIKPVKEG